jgi:hypothetical protein
VLDRELLAPATGAPNVQIWVFNAVIVIKPASMQNERRLGARLLRALRTGKQSDHGGADSGEVVFLCIVGARRELPLLPRRVRLACPGRPVLAASV